MAERVSVGLRDLVNRWDPLGVFDADAGEPASVDEYDCIVEPLVGLLAAGADSDQIARFLAWHMSRHMFGEPSRGPLAVEEAFAADVLDWYHGRAPPPPAR